MAPGALLFLACLILPESPRFLVRKEVAGENLGWIRGFGRDWATNEYYGRRERVCFKGTWGYHYPETMRSEK